MLSQTTSGFLRTAREVLAHKNPKRRSQIECINFQSSRQLEAPSFLFSQTKSPIQMGSISNTTHTFPAHLKLSWFEPGLPFKATSDSAPILAHFSHFVNPCYTLTMKFSKAYEPNQFEPDIYALWESSGAFLPKCRDQFSTENSLLSEKSPSKEGSREEMCSPLESFAIVMPPPNANGNLHIGHGLTTVLEDILTRYHRLRGYNTWYIPGADHAGFETWVVYERQLEAAGKSRFDFTRDQLYSGVWDFVHQQRGNMELQLRALGASCDWSALTFTLDPKVVARVYATFQQMWQDGLIYRGKRLVNYCTKHQTAFADIEVHYEDQKTPLYYMKYGPFVLATTRPETKFGDTAVAVHPDDQRYKEYIGQNITVEGVNGQFEVKVIADEMVDPAFGTGVVKITPAHDFNDWEAKQRHNLPAIQVIDQEGRMNDIAGRFKGMTVLEARAAVVEALKEKDLLVKVDEDYVTRVGHCYKCDTVIEPMLMEQWFVRIQPLAERAIQALEQGSIKFYPGSKKKVLLNYLKNLKDWNISRQIPWGIPVPLFRNREDPTDWIFNTNVADSEIVVDDKTYIRDEDTLDTWFSSGQWPYIVTNHLAKTRNNGFEEAVEETDESLPTNFEETLPSVTTEAARTWRLPATAGQPQLRSPKSRQQTFGPSFYPTSVMETGTDLLAPWVSRMIMLGLYATDQVPFKDVYLHGMVLDEHGQKMSKSKGNVMNPMEIISEYGSDAFRLGIVSSRSAGVNQAFGPSKVIAGRNLANKLWNISRFIQQMVDEDTGNGSSGESLKDNFEDVRVSPVKKSAAAEETMEEEAQSLLANFEETLPSVTTEAARTWRLPATAGQPQLRSPKSREQTFTTLNTGEDWICRELSDCKTQLDKLIGKYRFAEAAELLYDTIWNKYADWFIESQKIYKNIPLLQTTLEYTLTMLHPFAPFVTETIWQTLSWTDGLLITSQWPSKLKFDPLAAQQFETLMSIVSTVRGHLQRLSGGQKPNLLFGQDSLVNDHQVLIQFFTHVPAVLPTDAPKGMRIGLENREIYLDIDAATLQAYRQNLEDSILKLGAEIDRLNLRLTNPSYVKKAPKELVEQTKDQLTEKQSTLQRLKNQLNLI